MIFAMSLLWTAGLGFAAGNEGVAGGHAAGAAAVPAAPAAHPAGAPAATPASAPPSSPVASPAPGRSNAAATPLSNQRPTANDALDTNHRDRDRDPQFEYTYGYPWWGYGDGWGWGGNNSGFLTDDNYNSNSASTGSNNAASSTSPNVVAPGEVAPSAPSPAAHAAMAQNEVNHSPEVVQVNDAVQAAQTAYDLAQQRVIAALTNDPKYRQAVARERGAAGHLQQVKSSSPATQPGAVSTATIAAATLKMDQASEVTTMQQQAIAADPAAAAAKARLDRAVSDRDALVAKVSAQK